MERHGRLYRSEEDDNHCGRRCEGLPGQGYCSDGVGKEASVPNAVGALHALEGSPSTVDRRPLSCAVVEGWSAGHRVGIVGGEIRCSPTSLQTDIGPSTKHLYRQKDVDGGLRRDS